jgi:GGDEF domain-containing protein
MRDSIASREARILRLAYEDSLTGLPNRTRLDGAAAPALNAGSRQVRSPSSTSSASHRSTMRSGMPSVTACWPSWHLRLRGSMWPHERPGDADSVGRQIRHRGFDRQSIARRGASLARRRPAGTELRAPLAIDGQRLDVDASVGVALFPADANDAGRA